MREKINQTMKAIRYVLLTLATVIAGMWLATAVASADTHICVGGYGDNTGNGIASGKAAQGDPCDTAVAWPASIGLPGEPTNVQGSLNVAVPAVVEAYDAAPPGLVRFEGNSLGTIAVQQAGDYINRVRGGAAPDKPLEVITNGNPFGDSGINSPNAGVAGLAFNVGGAFFGVPQDVPQQAGINRTDVNDVWGNSANQWPQTQIADVATVGWNHTMPDPRAPHDTYVTAGANGPIINEIYGVGENPVSAAAARNGTPVPPPIDGFFDAVFPVNNPANTLPGIMPNGPLPVGDSVPAAGPPLP